jgi:hypothetical protein
MLTRSWLELIWADFWVLSRSRCISSGSTVGAEPAIKAEDPKPAVVSKATVGTDAGDGDVPDEVAAVAGKLASQTSYTFCLED